MTNTTKIDPLFHILDELSAPGKSIELSEARGQEKLLNSCQLPANTCGKRQEFEALGFVFGPENPNDPLFVNVTLQYGCC